MRDLLIYGALFLGWLLFNWIASRAKGAKRAERAAEHARSAPTYATPAPEPAPLDTEWGRAPPAAQPEPAYFPEYAAQPVPEYVPEQVRPPIQEEVPAFVAEPVPAAVRQPVPERRPAPVLRPRTTQLARRPRLRTPTDLRAAMVITAVLGPCRARQGWEPPDQA